MTARIDKHLEAYLKTCFPDRSNGIRAVYKPGSWQSNRYLQVPTILTADRYLHYEYCGGFVELHLEGKYQTAPFASFARRLREKTSDDSRLTWHNWQGNRAYRCRIDSPTGDWGQLREAMREIMAIFDPIINEINKQGEMEEKNDPYQGDCTFEEEGLDKESVCLASACLGKLFNNKLVIPDYQRNYCWQDKQVNDLWNSLKEIPNDGKSPYHLGTIILQKREDGTYSVIDGQQRLVTLSLIVRQLGYRGDIPLLRQKFLSQQSRDHIANARYLIDHLVETDRDTSLCQRIIKQLEFTVLILKESKLDLAYTFFSNENSKGVPLSDYDLLKAHHLRYISSEEQAEHLAGRWNRMIENENRRPLAICCRLGSGCASKTMTPTDGYVSRTSSPLRPHSLPSHPSESRSISTRRYKVEPISSSLWTPSPAKQSPSAASEPLKP